MTTDQLEIPVKLSFPVINLITFEMARAEKVASAVAEKVGKGFLTMKFKEMPDPPTISKHLDVIKKKGNDKGLVLLDTFFFDRMRSNPETIPALKSSLEILEAEGVNYIIAGRDSLSDEFVYHVTLSPMSDREILDLLRECEKFVKPEGDLFSDHERKVLCNNAKGLSHTQAKNVFTLSSYLHFKGEPYLKEIRKEKAHLLRDVGLEVLEPVTLEDVGGLERLKDFLTVRKAGWEKNLPVKGILLAGVSGGGKTLSARASAGILGTSLVRLDMSNFYSKFLGETEAKFARALSTIEQISPVTVLVDEMEKFFGQGAGEGEHEVSRRLLGNFLYWLSERKEKIFIVATANRPHILPAELTRAGRWDRSFFIDLPTVVEREKIFEIHLGKNQIDTAGFDLPALLRATEGYTGAEIEQAVIDALYLANAHDQDINQDLLLAAIEDVTPNSETRKEDTDQIRRLKDQGFYPANVEVEQAKRC